jgi:uncharacterized protein
MVKVFVLLVGLALTGLIWVGLTEAVGNPVRREARLTLTGLPARTPPYRIALLSDIHFGNRAMPRERLEAIVTEVNAAKPDLVVIVGDFVNGHNGKPETDLRELALPLSHLRARDGVVATLGNHDHWTDPHAVQEALESAGVDVLNNQPIQLGPLMVVGLDDSYSGHADVNAALAAVPTQSSAPIMVVTHSPDISSSLPAEIQLVLAGHTHCGQVVIPGIGSLAPVFGKLVGDRHYFNPHYLCGLVQDGRRTTLVTAGLGSGFIPIRIGAPSDWWLVTLNSLKDPETYRAPTH